jgi:hypothetical protein
LEEVITFYTSIFKNTRVTKIKRAGRQGFHRKLRTREGLRRQRLTLQRLDLGEIREKPRPKQNDDDRADAADDTGGDRSHETGKQAGFELAQLVGRANEE